MKIIKLYLFSSVVIAMMLNLSIMLILHAYFSISTVIFAGVVTLATTTFFFVRQYVKIPPAVSLIFGAILLEILVSPFRGYTGMQVCAIAGFTAFLFFTNFLIGQYHSEVKPLVVTAYIFAGLILFQGPIRIYDFKATLASFPDFLIHLLGIIAGYFFYQRKKILHTLNLSVSILIVLFVYFYGYNMWINKIDFGTFNGETHFKSPPAIQVKNAENKLIAVKKGKLTVMDFWFMGCKACFDEFPKFQKLYAGYKNNPNIQFYTVNQPYPADNDENPFKVLTDRGYTFPMVAANGDKSLIKSLQIVVFPTVVVMDADGYVVYKGDMAGASATIASYMHPGAKAEL